ncbi:MAG: CBS domain-containing protein [Elusimicrobiota bacterium]|jgi:magnesium transporter|nr:CBS domain-containing protein [Elusimicrobiota bacterium]
MFDTMQHKTSGQEMLENFIAANPAAAARFLENQPLGEAVFWLSSLKAASIIACFREMDPKAAAIQLRRLPLKQASRILLGIERAKAGEIFLSLPAHYKKRLTDTLEPRLLKTFEDSVAYGSNTVARFMHNNYLAFKTDAKVKEIITKIKALPKNKIPFNIYILDKGGRLGGLIKTPELALYPQESAAGSVMAKSFDKLGPFDTLDVAAALMAKNSAAAAPIVDEDGFLLGVLDFWRVSPQDCKKQSGKRGLVKLLAAVFGGARLLFLIIYFTGIQI